MCRHVFGKPRREIAKHDDAFGCSHREDKEKEIMLMIPGAGEKRRRHPESDVDQIERSDDAIAESEATRSIRIHIIPSRSPSHWEVVLYCASKDKASVRTM